MEAPANSVVQHLEGVLCSARKLEDSLEAEKKRSQKIAQEYLTTRTILEKSVRELQARLAERENKLQAIDTELTQYRNAWNEVLAREVQARNTVLELDSTKRAVNQLRAQIELLEKKNQEFLRSAASHSKHAETSLRDLQSAQIRILTAESKQRESQKELELALANRRNLAEEISTEKNRLANKLLIQYRAEQTEFRSAARTQMQNEIARQSAILEKKCETIASELKAAKIQVEETEKSRKLDNERARGRIAAIAAENQEIREEARLAIETKNGENTATTLRAERAEASAESSRRELAVQQMSVSHLQMKFETARKDSNKAMLVERLRHEEDIRRLQLNIESLLENGAFAEKIESMDEGARVFIAHPVSSSVPNRSKKEATRSDDSMEKNL